MAKPSRDDPSTSGAHGIRQWNAIQKALAGTDGVKTIADLTPGGARFTGQLAKAGYQVIGGDRKLPTSQHDDIRGDGHADADALPFASKSVDCVMSVRFPLHVDADARRQLLREFGRISRRWVIADYRHHFSISASRMKSEFEDAGLRIAHAIPVRRFLSNQWLVLAESGFTDPQGLAIRLRDTQFAALVVAEKLGEGKRSVVYRAQWNGRDVGVKVYKPAAIAAHARKHRLPLAEFEHLRNKAFFQARGMAKYVAEPLGLVVEPGFQMTLQELVDGEVYYFAQRDHAAFISPRFMDELTELVALSHQARLYDIDLHAMNVMVDRRTGSPKLFDFNQIPFNERPQNPLVKLALKLGLLGQQSRDLRKLAHFNDFERIERRLLKFYGQSRDTRP
jgi:SAM-dependent methyltransferase